MKNLIKLIAISAGLLMSTTVFATVSSNHVKSVNSKSQAEPAAVSVKSQAEPAPPAV